MITKNITPNMAVAGAVKLLKQKSLCGTLFVNLEVTKSCNARCDCCDSWKTMDETRITDYLPIIKKFGPMYINITGGEPLLRKDLPAIVRRIKDNMRLSAPK
ncbi:MAG: radical SAM protein [Candidatus Methylomirabilales bacterium]